MERPIEIVVLGLVVGAVAVVVLGSSRSSHTRQIVAATAIGVSAAFAVLTQTMDTIPDNLELPIAALALLALTATALAHARRAHR